ARVPLAGNLQLPFVDEANRRNMMRLEDRRNRAIDSLQLFQVAGSVVRTGFGAGQVVNCDDQHALSRGLRGGFSPVQAGKGGQRHTRSEQHRQRKGAEILLHHHPSGLAQFTWFVSVQEERHCAPSWSRQAPRKNLEREKGIEPSPLAWEASVLPLNYSRPG